MNCRPDQDHCRLLIPVSLDVLENKVGEGTSLRLGQHPGRVTHPGYEYGVIRMNAETGLDFSIVTDGVPDPAYVAV
jgi:hypothetical protein